MKVQFTIPGDPVAKGRPKFTRTGFAYTPQKTARYENLVRLAYAGEYPDRNPSESAVSISIVSTFPVPASWPKKKKLLAIMEKIFKKSRPDLDNLIKSVCDGLNEVAWKDDAQIFELYACKKYGEVPKTEVEIDFIEEDPE